MSTPLPGDCASRPLVTEVYAAPGNPGIAHVATCLPVRRPHGLCHIGRTSAAPISLSSDPKRPSSRALSIVFRSRGRPIVGPTADNAALEGSKVHAKHFMDAAGVPTARFETVSNAAASARMPSGSFGFPVVLKTDGLAAGKGVIIANTREEAEAALATLGFPAW